MIKNAFFLFGICAAIFVLFLPSYLQMQGMHERNSSFEHQIKELTAENEALLEERRRLEEDPAYFERFAREKFGIIKDGEMIYKIVPAGMAGTAGIVGTVGATNTVITNGLAGNAKKAATPVAKVPAKTSAKKKKTPSKKTPVKATSKPVTNKAVLQ